MKRANEKDSENKSNLKKTKTDHPEYGQDKLFMPTRTVPTERKAMKSLAELIKPPVDIEPIVLSSDDEEEINMHKTALAKSLNVAPPPPTENKVEEKETVVPAVSPTQSTPSYQKIVPPKRTFPATNLDQPSSSKSTPKFVSPVHIPTPTGFSSASRPIAPATVTMSITVPNSTQPSVEKETINTQSLENKPTPEPPKAVPVVTFLDSSDDDEMDEKEAPKVTEKTKELEKADIDTVTIENDGMNAAPSLPAAPSENMSEVDEIQSDTETESVALSNKDDVSVIKPLETIIEEEHTDSDNNHQSNSRPIRESRSRISTYNDIANSVDPAKFGYNSFSDEEETTTAKSNNTTANTRKQKKRSSPPKVLHAAIVLNAFTRDLSSRRHLKTGFVYDTAMSYHATPNPMEIHPEDPRRIFKIFNILDQHGLLQECERITSRRATKQEILLVHNIIHYRKMRETADLKSKSDYMAMENDYDSIYLNSNSFESGLYAVGSLIELMEAVITNQVKNAFAIIRPPGHHAESDMPMGFCLFNNVAIATRDSMQRLGVKKTLIIDWDVHFGNGTQAIFSEDPNVLYVSLHRFEEGSFYPHDEKGRAEYTGHGNGVGKTLNIPWPCAGMTDADYLYAFREVIIPIALEFSPDVVIVSAGFDAAINDPIGKCNVTPAGYGQMTHMLKAIAHGKLVIALEGGYDLNSIAVSALACMNVLLGDAPEPIASYLTPKQECVDTIEAVKRVQKKFWTCLSW